MSTGSPHNRRYFPPIPSLDLILQSASAGKSTDILSAVVDTGADITLVPLALLRQIDAPELDEVRLYSHWGHATSAITYLVDVRFGNDTLSGIEVVADIRSQEVLVGRDILNKLMLFIDGPAFSTQIATRRPRLR